MKKLIVAISILLLAMISGDAIADETAISSGEKTTSEVIHNSEGKLYAVEVITDGSNDAKLIVYDGISSSGKVVFEGTVTGANHFGGRIFFPPIKINAGIYCAITGTGASYIIDYARN